MRGPWKAPYRANILLERLSEGLALLNAAGTALHIHPDTDTNGPLDGPFIRTDLGIPSSSQRPVPPREHQTRSRSSAVMHLTPEVEVPGSNPRGGGGVSRSAWQFLGCL